jgi:large-conductance mechanosensitive channel
MTGLQPAREWHNALFSISGDTIHQVAMALCLCAATALGLAFFSTYIIPFIVVATCVSMVVEFFSDLHKHNTWDDEPAEPAEPANHGQ